MVIKMVIKIRGTHDNKSSTRDYKNAFYCMYTRVVSESDAKAPFELECVTSPRGSHRAHARGDAGRGVPTAGTVLYLMGL